MPDRPGNNRIDSFRNLLSGSGYVQLIFFVPGLDETLRVGGEAKLSADADLLASMIEFGKPPRAVLDITVREAYFHCGKALMRSKLWSPESRVARSAQPSISEVIHEQTGRARRSRRRPSKRGSRRNSSRKTESSRRRPGRPLLCLTSQQ
jgi:hypothetical protein